MSIVDGGKGLGKRWRLTADGRFAEKEQQVLKEGLDEEEEQEEKRKRVEEENARSWRWLRSTFSGCQASHTAASQPRGKVTVSTPPLLDDQDGDE